MALLDREELTICATATPPGSGGVAIIRVSGPESLNYVSRLCPFIPAQPESHRMYFGTFVSESKEGIDEVLVAYFAQGRSFTGDQTLEINCHGGSQITKEILSELIKAGCHLAEPGEFTFRAFMNGRVDLVQAESILELIESGSKAASRLALRQLKGGLSKQLAEIEDDLTWTLAQLEANIDFASEDIEIASSEALQSKVKKVANGLSTLVESYKVGRLVSEGTSVALVGNPNVGKSSLLNAFLGEEKAIVTEVPGTTRDAVEGQITADGVKLNFVDTAGIRDANDKVEALGISKSRILAQESDVILFLVDLSQPISIFDYNILSELDLDRVIIIGNKRDKAQIEPKGFKEWIFKGFEEISAGRMLSADSILNLEKMSDEKFFTVSALTAEGINEVLSHLASLSKVGERGSAVLSNVRHFELLTQALKASERALNCLQKDGSPDIVALELQSALSPIFETLGKQVDDEVMDRVFKEFCLGK